MLGTLPESVMDTLDLVVISPGVPCDLPEVLLMKEKGIRIWGEVELAYECGKGDVLAVTGTNGKTTTTSLLGADRASLEKGSVHSRKHRKSLYGCSPENDGRGGDGCRDQQLPA